MLEYVKIFKIHLLISILCGRIIIEFIVFFRMRHVSFARSHTVTSFDNVSLKSANSSKSLERLIDGRKTPEPVGLVESPKIIVLGTIVIYHARVIIFKTIY